jgi:hypothetical protein
MATILNGPDGGASTAQYHVGAFTLLVMATGSPFIVILISPAPLAADPVSVRVNHLQGTRSLGDIRSLGHSAAIGTEAAGGPAINQRTSAFPESPARLRGKGIELPSQRSPGHSASLGADATDSLVRDQCTIAFPKCLSSPVFPSSLPPQEAGWLLDSS